MKLIIASDLHGSASSGKAVIDKAEEKEQIIFLGDIFNHGPRNPLPEGWAPMELSKLLNENKKRLSVVKGNCDSEVDQMISEFIFKNKITKTIGGRKLVFTHGHKINIDNPLKNLKSGSVVFYGHFHIPFIKEKDGVYYVNPGSCALPFQNYPKSYAIYENGIIQIKNLITDEILIEKKL